MLKILSCFMAGLLATAGAFALENHVIPAGGFYDGVVLHTAQDVSGTAITLINPRYIGDLAIQDADASNAVWVAVGTTTNDWKLIKLPLTSVQCTVTNLDANGTTNIINFIGTVSYP